MMGTMVGLWLSPFYRLTSVLGPPAGIPDLSLVEKIMSMREIDGWVLPPPIVEELAVNPELLEGFQKAEFILTGGGKQITYTR